MISSLAGQGFDVQTPRVMLGVAPSGYYDWKVRPPSARTLRPAGEIAQVNKDSGGTYGTLRVTAELRYGRGSCHEGANFFAGAFTGLITFNRHPKRAITVDWGDRRPRISDRCGRHRLLHSPARPLRAALRTGRPPASAGRRRLGPAWRASLVATAEAR